MHIGFITSEYPHPELSKSGGLGTSIKNLAQQLVAHQVEVSVFIYSQVKDAVINDKGVVIHMIKHQQYAIAGWYKHRKFLQRKIQHWVNEKEIDLLEATDWTGITAFMKFSIPLIIRLNGSDGYFCHLEQRPQKLKNKFFEKRALKNADHIVSVSDFTAKMTNKVFGFQRDMEVIHNGISVEDFKPIKVAINKDQLLYFGTLVRKKGVLELAQAFNQLILKHKNANLLLLGKDNMDVIEQRLTSEIFFDLLSEEAKKKVTHLQEVPYAEVFNYIAKAHVVVLPSFAEAYPMTWMEAMAMEKPLVTSNIGWANEMMIHGETGYTVDPKDHTVFAEKIGSLLENDKLCEKFGKAARERVVTLFASDVIAKQNIVYYKSLLNIND